MYDVETFPVGSFQCNCSVLAHRESRQAMIVDPGDDAQEILDRVVSAGLKVTALWHTHAHIDHVGATLVLLGALTEINLQHGLAAPRVCLHEGDRWLYENIALQAQMLRLRPFEVPAHFVGIRDGESYENLPSLRALHTPGHTPGSCCLEMSTPCEIEIERPLRAGFSPSAPRVLFSGDTLFRRSIGRTDLWGGDSAKIVKSISNRLLKLKPETVVIPGHGPLTTIEEESAKNPFVRA